MRLRNISIHHSSMLIIMLIILPILVIICGINYLSLRNNILYNANIAINQSENSVANTIHHTEQDYELVSSYYEPMMRDSLEVFKNEYIQHQSNLDEIDFQSMQEKYNNLLDFYIIDSDGVIIYSTFSPSLGIDFKKIPSFYKKLTEVREGNEIQISKITSELNTYELRKWGYCPTDDHQFILEVGLSSAELKKHIQKIDYIGMEEELKKENPYIANISVFDEHHFILGHEKIEEDPKEIQVIDKLLQSGQRYVLNNDMGLPQVEYFLVDSLSSALDDSKKVIKIEYDYSSITKKMNEAMMKTILFIIGYILISLFIVSKWTHKFITKPLLHITKNVKKISDRILNVQTDVHNGNEINQLAQAFDEMSMKLSQNVISIHNLENIINSVGDIFFILDEDFKIKKINKYAVLLLGYHFDEIENQPIYMFFDSTFAENQIIEKIKRKGTAENIENFLIKSDGSRVVVLSNFAPLRNDDGGIYGYICISKDITERKNVEGTLVKVEDAAESANLAKSQFLANMSHEIRTPMNGIIGMTELTLMSELTTEQRGYLSIVKSSAAALLRVINDILDYSKIEAEKVNLENRPFDIRGMINEVVDLFLITAKQKNLYIKWNIDQQIPTELIGDSMRLRQILSNLVGNAIKFTAKGGVIVTTSLEKAFEDRIKIKVLVTDTGIGISKDKINKLFKRFSQVDDSSTRKFGGTGLGLAISKNLVEMMGGEIGVESEYSVGSKFFFTAELGVKKEKELFTREPIFPENDIYNNSHLETKKVLVAENDEINRKLACMLLMKKDFTVVTAENGSEAVAIHGREPFDLILMDVNMPYLDGYSATALIREREQKINKHTPIIGLAAYARSGDKDKCLEAGMDDYISKPIDVKEFDEVIQKWLMDSEARLAALELIEELKNSPFDK